MLAKDLRFSEIVRINPKTGSPHFIGQRVFLTGVATMKRFYADIYRVMGERRASEIYTRLGYDTGIAGGSALKVMYDINHPKELLDVPKYALPMMGMAVEVRSESQYDPEKGIFQYSFECESAFEPLLWNLIHDSKSNHPICHTLSGAASGYLSAITGEDIFVREISCKAQGENHCRFEAKRIEEWGEWGKEFQRVIRSEALDEELIFLQHELNKSKKFVEKQKKEIERLKLESSAKKELQQGIVYRSPQMKHLLDTAEIAAPTDATILIQGESGAGKEVVAKYIHKCSNRSEAPFLAINCAAIPSTLLESELFGHVKGAFTGATQDKTGLFTKAGNGTIFLDEIGELAFEVQSKLLRVLQEKEVLPIGSVTALPVKARIIAATNKNLKQMVSESKFRNDLFYRVSAFPLHIAPLRERPEDIILLARHFLSRQSEHHPGFSPESLNKIRHYDWPGNIRELQNCVEYAYILSRNEEIQVAHLPHDLKKESESCVSDFFEDYPSPKELISRYAKYVLESTGGDKPRAAELMGVSLPTLWRYLKKDTH